MLNIHPVEKPSAVTPEQMLVDAPTAAKLLSIGERTLWRLTDRGEILPVKIGRAVRYSVADLQSFIDKARAKPAAAAVPNGAGDSTEAIARQA